MSKYGDKHKERTASCYVCDKPGERLAMTANGPQWHCDQHYAEYVQIMKP